MRHEPDYETATAVHASRPAHVRAKARQMAQQIRRENMTPAELSADRKRRLDELETLARGDDDDRGAAA